MPLRNPFRKTVGLNGVESPLDPDQQETATDGLKESNDVLKRTPAISVKSNEEPNEYKMSVVDQSGVYLPPSPPEKKPFWHRSNGSQSSNHRSVLNENEPFNISRESFDSYRRSFDISARSPIPQMDLTPPRQSLDSRAMRLPRPTTSTSFNPDRRKLDPPRQVVDEEGFEDVGLNDDTTKPKKKGLFARFGASGEPGSDGAAPRPASSSSNHHGFSLTGRKRGKSGQGAELGNMDRKKGDAPVQAQAPEIKEEPTTSS